VQQKMRLFEIVIDPLRKLKDLLQSNISSSVYALHEQIQTKSSSFSIYPIDLFSMDEIEDFLSELTVARKLVRAELSEDSQAHYIISELINYFNEQ
jgi:hypothetical protein